VRECGSPQNVLTILDLWPHGKSARRWSGRHKPPLFETRWRGHRGGYGQM